MSPVLKSVVGHRCRSEQLAETECDRVMLHLSLRHKLCIAVRPSSAEKIFLLGARP